MRRDALLAARHHDHLGAGDGVPEQVEPEERVGGVGRDTEVVGVEGVDVDEVAVRRYVREQEANDGGQERLDLNLD